MSITSYPTYNHNPFRVNDSHFREFPSISLKTAELTKKVGDFEEHIRLYDYDSIVNLNSMAIKILGFVFKELSFDIVRINIQELADELNVKSRSTVYRGLIDLLDAQFLVRKAGTDTYFINPAKVFKGKRSEWYQQMHNHDLKEANQGIHTEKIRTYKTTSKLK